MTCRPRDLFPTSSNSKPIMQRALVYILLGIGSSGDSRFRKKSEKICVERKQEKGSIAFGTGRGGPSCLIREARVEKMADYGVEKAIVEPHSCAYKVGEEGSRDRKILRDTVQA